MGYGEARSQFLIAAMEALPAKSLVLIEEPEISLHPHAQYEFGHYLVDVSARKGHQILLTTHSEPLLSALSSQSRLYLHVGATGVETVSGLTALQARSLMSRGHDKALHVLVEDVVAKAILTEILRRTDATFLSTIAIYDGGGAKSLAETIRTLAVTGLPVAAVLDGDQQPTPNSNIFKLPSNEAPERDLFANATVQSHMQSTYGLDLADFATGLAGVNHHEWPRRLAQQVSQDEAALVSEMARAYAASIPESDATTLTTLLREVSRR
jgi:hypothetical protein